MIGETVNEKFEIVSSDNDVIGVTQLIQGADALIIIFVPFCFGEEVNLSMESLVMDVSDRLEEFNNRDIRVVCVTRYEDNLFIGFTFSPCSIL